MVYDLGREHLVKILASGLGRKLLSLVWHVLGRFKNSCVTNQTNLTD